MVAVALYICQLPADVALDGCAGVVVTARQHIYAAHLFAADSDRLGLVQLLVAARGQVLLVLVVHVAERLQLGQSELHAFGFLEFLGVMDQVAGSQALLPLFHRGGTVQQLHLQHLQLFDGVGAQYLPLKWVMFDWGRFHALLLLVGLVPGVDVVGCQLPLVGRELPQLNQCPFGCPFHPTKSLNLTVGWLPSTPRYY